MPTSASRGLITGYYTHIDWRRDLKARSRKALVLGKDVLAIKDIDRRLLCTALRWRSTTGLLISQRGAKVVIVHACRGISQCERTLVK